MLLGGACLLLRCGQVGGPARVDPGCEAVCWAAWLLAFVLPQAGEAWAVVGLQKWHALVVYGSASSSSAVGSARGSAAVRRSCSLHL